MNITYPTPGNNTTSVPEGYSCSVSAETAKASPAPDSPAVPRTSVIRSRSQLPTKRDDCHKSHVPQHRGAHGHQDRDRWTCPTWARSPWTSQCDNGQSFNNLDIAYPTPGFITVSGIETPATCTVTEDPVPGAPTNYHWGTTVIGAGVSVTYGQETTPNVNVTNPLIRNTAGLTVTKVVTGGPADYSGTFTVDVSCDNGQSFNNLDIAYPTPGFITVSGIETPATCTVTEDPVPGAPTNYHWGTTVDRCRRQRHLRPGDDTERQRDEPADPQHRGAHGHQGRDRWTCRLLGHVHRGRLV